MCGPVPEHAGTVRGREDRNGLFFRDGLYFGIGRHRRRDRGSSGSPAPLRGREANARPRPAGLPGPAGPGRARAWPWPRPRRPRPRSGAPPSPPDDISGANSSTYTLLDADLGKTLKVRVRFDDDDGNTETLTSTATATVVAAATTNTAPTAAHKTVTTGEDRAYAFTAADFGFDDADGDTLASVTIVILPTAGTLALSGTAVMAADVVTKTQIDGGMLTFTPARDAHGDAYTSFTFTVNDGTDDSAIAYTMTIDVTDAPAPVCGVPSYGDRREIWTGTVGVGRAENNQLVSYGFDEGSSVGTLLPSQSFFIGSNNYVIDAILVGLSGNLEFVLDGNSELTIRELAALRLHVCDVDYDTWTRRVRRARDGGTDGSGQDGLAGVGRARRDGHISRACA